MRNLDQLINRYEIHLKDLVVQRKLDQLIYTEIPEEAPTEVDAALRDNRESEKKLAEYRERIRNIDEELTQLTRYTWAKTVNKIEKNGNPPQRKSSKFRRRLNNCSGKSMKLKRC